MDRKKNIRRKNKFCYNEKFWSTINNMFFCFYLYLYLFHYCCYTIIICQVPLEYVFNLSSTIKICLYFDDIMIIIIYNNNITCGRFSLLPCIPLVDSNNKYIAESLVTNPLLTWLPLHFLTQWAYSEWSVILGINSKGMHKTWLLDIRIEQFSYFVVL
jgi:hypothetical protein